MMASLRGKKGFGAKIEEGKIKEIFKFGEIPTEENNLYLKPVSWDGKPYKLTISIDKPGTVVKLDAARWLHLFLRLARFFLHSLLFPLLPFPRLQPPLTLWLPAVTIPPYSPRCTIFLHHVTAHSLTSHSPVLDVHAPLQHKISPL